MYTHKKLTTNKLILYIFTFILILSVLATNIFSFLGGNNKTTTIDIIKPQNLGKGIGKISSFFYFPPFKPLDHTMCFSLDTYVEQKLPVDMLKKAVINNWKIEIHGIYPESDINKRLNFDFIDFIPFKHNKKKKPYNYIRPKFFIGYRKGHKNTLIIAVTPGADYIYHYSSMVRHYLTKLTITSAFDDIIKIYRYPELEKNITKWTNLDKRFIKKGDTVILGHVQKLESLLKRKTSSELVERNENSYYESKRYKLPTGKVITFLGVKYSFWGNISGKIITALCESGAVEIIYAAKLGSMTNSKDIYEKIYSPTKYFTMRGEGIIDFITDVENGFAKRFPECDTKWHVSIPTVLEEDFKQRKIASDIGAQSIDNEISQMALSVSKYNKKNQKNVRFNPVHFATDYVRSLEEKELEVNHDLSNNRTPAAQNKKNKIIDKITRKLIIYLVSE